MSKIAGRRKLRSSQICLIFSRGHKIGFLGARDLIFFLKWPSCTILSCYIVFEPILCLKKLFFSTEVWRWYLLDIGLKLIFILIILMRFFDLVDFMEYKWNRFEFWPQNLDILFLLWMLGERGRAYYWDWHTFILEVANNKMCGGCGCVM
jgi:hypothetical protein